MTSDVVSYIGIKESATSSVDRVPGYEPVGRRFESCVARHETSDFHQKSLVFCYFGLLTACGVLFEK